MLRNPRRCGWSVQLRHYRDPTPTTTIAREVQRNARPETDGSAIILASQLDTVKTGCGWLLPSDGNHLNAGNGAPDIDIRSMPDDIGRQTTVLDALDDGGCCVVVGSDQQCHAERCRRPQKLVNGNVLGHWMTEWTVLQGAA